MENIIIRNLFRLVGAGAFGNMSEAIEPMSEFKWGKLHRIVEMQQLTWHFNEGAKLYLSKAGTCIPPNLLSECSASTRYSLHNFRTLMSEIHLDMPLLDKRLHNLIDSEIHSIDTSAEALTLLAIIVDTINDMLNSGMVVRGVVNMGMYLRTTGDKIDFEKLDRWLGRLMLRRMAQLQGSILVAVFGFTPDEIPFLRHQEPAARKLCIKSLDLIQRDAASEWHFRQDSTGLIHNNSTVLRRNLRRSIRYVNYAPIETIGNFISKFVRSLSEIEE